MPGGRDHAENVDDYNPCDLKFRRDDCERFVGVPRDRSEIEIRDHSESQVQDVEQQKEKKENAGRPLENVKPVASVTVAQRIWLRFRRNYYAIDRVKKQRQKYAEDLDQQQKRDIMNFLYRFIKARLAVHRLCVREHVHEEKDTKRNDACDLVQFSQ